MRKTIAFALAALSLAPASNSAQEHRSLALPVEATSAVQRENPRRGYEGGADVGCAVRWERAYDGWGGYVGDRKVKICN